MLCYIAIAMQAPPGVAMERRDPNVTDSATQSDIQPEQLPRGWARYAPFAVGAVLVLRAFALYIATLAPSVMPGDYAEFQFSAAILGVPHPTGYPLYILLGKLFTMLPVGDVAYRVNLSSAVYMAG